MTLSNRYYIYVDASLQGWAFVLYSANLGRDNKLKLDSLTGIKFELSNHGKWDEKLTNNEAEYKAMIIALEFCYEYGINELVVFTDSEIVELQMKGIYKVKKPELFALCNMAKEVFQKFPVRGLYHVKGIDNPADDLTRLK